MHHHYDPHGFKRVTDPQLAAALFANGLLYEKRSGDPVELSYGWGHGIEQWIPRMDYKDWTFYVRLEE